MEVITSGKQDYHLPPFFYFALDDIDLIRYRQEIFRDLDEELLDRAEFFTEKMAIARRYITLSEKLHYRFHREGWFLEAALVYIDALTGLLSDLRKTSIKSRGLLGFRDFLETYAASDRFTTFVSEAKRLKMELENIQYLVNIRGSRVRVRKYEGETDYTQEIEHTFEKFKLGDVKDFSVDLHPGSGMNHVYAKILLCVGKLFDVIFQDLENFSAAHADFLDERMCRFEREIQFYISYLRFTQRIKRNGLKFSQPEISPTDKAVRVSAGFDIALANKAFFEKISVVSNDFLLENEERIIVVSGPNQGGKTTFARMFGQLLFLARLGCPVPAAKAKIFLCDNVFTHFEREEDIRNLRGKLKDDLVRIQKILQDATPRSIIILNEIFTSTTLKDAVFLSSQIIERIKGLDSLCVCVTFLDEISRLGEKVVSMVGTVNPEDPSLRTYKFFRKPADGLAYALFIAEKYSLTYGQIKERIQQ
jgi:hypothetical protein